MRKAETMKQVYVRVGTESLLKEKNEIWKGQKQCFERLLFERVEIKDTSTVMSGM